MTGQTRLKIAYLCDVHPEHTQPYSGGNSRIFGALAERADVTVLPQGWGLAEPARRAIYALPDAAQLRLRWRTHLALARIIAAPLNRMLARGGFDILFGAYSFQSMSRIQVPAQMLGVFTSDATPTVYKRSEIGQSFGSSRLSRWALDPLTLRAERRIYNSADLLLWPSEWLKREADKLFDLPPGRAHVLPWGANIQDPGTKGPASAFGPGQPVHFLVIGRDWFAKGGPVAFDTMNILRSRGIDARLTVIGTTPPDFHRNEHVTVLGPLDKSVPDEAAQFTAAMRAAHFLVQPSFESYGFAFCEASAFGLPSLCRDVGGVPVRDGVNGHALPADAGPEAFAALVAGYLDRPADYTALRASARAEYQTRLNWPAWGDATIEVMRDALARKRATGSTQG